MIVTHFTTLLLLFLSTTAAATPQPNYSKLDLPAVIGAIPDLSHIHSLLTHHPNSSTTLSKLNNVTVFLGKGPDPTNLDYTIVDGIHPSRSFTTDKTFLHTHLTDPTHSNVTGGQVLEVQKRSADVTTVVGGVRNNRTVVAQIVQPDIKFQNGLLHILSTPVPPPSTALTTAYALNLTTLTSPAAAAILRADQSYSDITRVFADSPAWQPYLQRLVRNLTAEQKERAEDGNLVKGTVVYSTGFTREGNIVASVDRLEDDLVFQVEGDGRGRLEVNGVRVTREDVLVANGVLRGVERPVFPYGFVPPIPEPSAVP